MANWYKIPTSWRMTEREYNANVTGMNIVFGAVLGFVLAGAESLAAKDFALLLIISATIAVLILYLGSSEYKLFNAVLVALAIGFLPHLLEDILALADVPKLQPTLAVWALMVLAVEILPRKQSNDSLENE